ncbi:MAG: hypothetical protein E7478_02755 [Ruminococcaceae bacterium]|nr:hypothetical protein [Oscillospiraceae bacterium]
MEFILYFVLRRFFVSVKTDAHGIHLRKGLIFRRVSFVPAAVISSVQVKRTPLLRLLCGKKVTIRALGGKVTFYLKNNEPLSFLPQQEISLSLRHRSGSVLLGALCETRALGGMILFSTSLTRIGNILGSGYYDRIMNAINQTAQGFDKLLSDLRIAVPSVTAVLAVFVAAAWAFAFLRNSLRLCRFNVGIGACYAIARHGLLTLYEDIVVPNNLSASVISNTASTLLFRAAPIYCGDILTVLPMDNAAQNTAFRHLTGITLPDRFCTIPPKKAIFGHIAVPFGWGAAFAAALVLCYLTNSDPILRTLLWAGVWVCLWYSFLFGMYMLRSGTTQHSNATIMSARHGVRLYTACIPADSTAYRRTDVNIFQLKDDMCDMRIYCRGHLRLRLRNVPNDQRT